MEDPYFMTIETRDNLEGIIIDGLRTSISEISAAYALKTQDLDAAKKSRFYVKLKFSEGTTMGTVADIKQELRKLHVLNVKYYLPDEE